MPFVSRYVDIHTHVNLAAFADDWKEVCERAQSASVSFLNVGTQRDTSARAVEIAHAYDGGVYAVVGLHPVHTSRSFHDAQEFTDVEKGFVSRGEIFDAEHYRELARDVKTVAIGECGLDYMRLEEDVYEKQREAFVAQIQLANEVQKPLMLHVRSSAEKNAYRDAVAIVREYATVPGNVHFFAGTYEDAKEYLSLGFTVSFTGVITFARTYDDVIRNIPLDMLHAETDAPYVTPVPHRGTRNEPIRVVEVVKKIAEIRGEDEEKVALQLRQNALRLFGI